MKKSASFFAFGGTLNFIFIVLDLAGLDFIIKFFP